MNEASLPALRGRTLHQRIGLHTGVGVVGNIGSKRRFNYTVIGDSANLASRLEGATKQYGVKVLLSEATVRAFLPALAALTVIGALGWAAFALRPPR